MSYQKRIRVHAYGPYHRSSFIDIHNKLNLNVTHVNPGEGPPFYDVNFNSQLQYYDFLHLWRSLIPECKFLWYVPRSYSAIRYNNNLSF